MNLSRHTPPHRSGHPGHAPWAIALLAAAALLLPRCAPAQQTPAPTTKPAAGSDQDWPRPRFDQRKDERHEMVRRQLAGRGIRSAATLEAMRNVPRHLFVPDSEQRHAYDDSPLPIGYGQTISQPYIVGLMTQALDLGPDDKVLEIGTGSGYQAAVLAELTPHVFSIEVLDPLYKQASQRLGRLGYATVQAKRGDGYFGWHEHAPFDAIIVTCAAGHIPSPLFDQLKAGGRMVIPVGGPFATQRLILVAKTEDGRRTSSTLCPVRFVPMVGHTGQKP